MYQKKYFNRNDRTDVVVMYASGIAAADLAKHALIPDNLKPQLKSVSTQLNNLGQKIFNALPDDEFKKLQNFNNTYGLDLRPRTSVNNFNIGQDQYFDMLEFVMSEICSKCDGKREKCALRDQLIDICAGGSKLDVCEYSLKQLTDAVKENSVATNHA